MEALDNYQLIIPDLPGHGLSALTQEVLTMDHLADVCLDILDALEIEAAHVVGHSMGGYVACAMAEKDPHRIVSLCMFQSSAAADTPEKKVLRDRAMEAVNTHQDHYVRSMITSLFAEMNIARLSATIERLVAEAKGMHPQAIIGCLLGMKERPSCIEMLKDRQFPTAYILGSEDSRLPIDEMLSECSRIGANVKCFDGVGHMAQFEVPDEAASYLATWLMANARS